MSENVCFVRFLADDVWKLAVSHAYVYHDFGIKQIVMGTSNTSKRILLLTTLFTVLNLMSAQGQTTFTVSNTGDSGAGSLRQAILDAEANAGADVIDLTGINGTITLVSGLPNITEDLTINGAGTATIIDGAGQFRPFFIGGSISSSTEEPVVSLSDMTIQNGFAQGGTPNGNAGGGAGMGGALFINDGQLTITNVTFDNNHAIGGDGGENQFIGGGIGSDGPFANAGGHAAAVPAPFFGGNGQFGAGGGGGIYYLNYGGGAKGGNGGYGAGGGGGGRTNSDGSGGGIGGSTTGFGGNGGTATDLTTPGGGGGAGLGGAIFLRNGNIDLMSCSFTNNSTTGGLGGSPSGGNGQGKGGAIYNAFGGIYDQNSIFSNNAAANAGGNASDNTNNYGQLQIDDSNAPAVTFDPADLATDIVKTSNITITLDKTAFLNNVEIDNNDLQSIISLNQGSASGTLVAFTATISDNVITVNPDADLNISETYFVTFGIVSDYFGNTSTPQTVSFSTTPNLPPTFTLSQTVFTYLEGYTGGAGTDGTTWISNIDDGDPALNQNTTISFEILSGSELFNNPPAVGNPLNNLAFTLAGGDLSGSAIVSVIVTDDGPGNASSSQQFIVNVEEVNDPPTWSAESTLVFTEDVESEISIPNHFEFFSGSGESGQLLTITVDQNNFNDVFTGMQIDSDGTLTIQIDNSKYYALNDDAAVTIPFTIQDDGGTANGGNDTNGGNMHFNIENTIDDPAFFAGSSAGSSSVNEGAFLNYTIVLRDEDTGDAIITAIDGPDWVSYEHGTNGSIYTDPITGQEFGDRAYKIQGTPASDEDVGVHTITLTVNGDPVAFDIEVIDTDSSPQGSLIENLSIDEGAGLITFLLIENLNDGDAALEQTLIPDYFQQSTNGIPYSQVFKSGPIFNVNTGEVTLELQPDYFGQDITFDVVIFDDLMDQDDYSNELEFNDIPLIVNSVEDFPEFVNPIPTSVNEGVNYQFDMETRDGDGDMVTVEAITIPSWMSIDGSILSGIATEAEVGDHSVSFRLTDAKGNETLVSETVTVVDVQNPPTDITLSPETIDETLQIGEFVTLGVVDADLTETYTYSLVSGGGDTDNGSFTISADHLLVQENLRFETKSSYSIRLRVDDSGGLAFEKSVTIAINNVIVDPSDILISNSSLDENQNAGIQIGSFSNNNGNDGIVYQYALVSGSGDADNASFDIVNGQLQSSETFDYEEKSNYAIRVRVDGNTGGYFEKEFTIAINDVDEIPVIPALILPDALEDELYFGGVSTSDPEGPVTISVIEPSWLSFQEVTPSVQIIAGVSGGGDADGDALTEAEFNQVADAELGPDGTLYFTDALNHDVKKFKDGVVTTIAGSTPGNTNGNGTNAQFERPHGIALDHLGNIYITEYVNHNIKKIDPQGNVTLLAGMSAQGTTDGEGTAAGFKFPNDIEMGPDGFLYVADQRNNSIRRVSTSGDVTTFATGLSEPHWMEFMDDGALLVSSFQSGLYKVLADGSVSIFDAAEISIYGLDIDAYGNILIADQNGQKVTKIAPDGNKSIVVGSGALSLPGADANSGRVIVATTSGFILYGEGRLTPDDRFYSVTSGSYITGTPLSQEIGNVNVVVEVTDGTGNVVTETSMIEVINVNDAPTALSLSNNTIDEFLLSGTSVGTLTTTDEDANDTFTYSLIAGTGDTDNASFAIDGDQLVSTEIFNFDTKTNYSVRVETADSEGEKIEEQFTITINDVSDTPPQFLSTPVVTATEGSAYNYNVVADDLLNESVGITATSKPDWLSFDFTLPSVTTLFPYGGTFTIGSDNRYYLLSGTNVLTATPTDQTITSLLASNDLTNAVDDITVSPSGDVFVIDDYKHIKKISGGVLSTLTTVTTDILRLGFHPDGFLIFLEDDNGQRNLKKLTMGGVVSSIVDNVSYSSGFDISPSGDIAFVTSVGQSIAVYDENGNSSGEISMPHNSNNFSDPPNIGEVEVYLISELAYDNLGRLYVHYSVIDEESTIKGMIALVSLSGNALDILEYGDGFDIRRADLDANNNLNFSSSFDVAVPNTVEIKILDAWGFALTGTPATGDVGTNNVTLTASDGATDVQQTFDIEVDFLNDDPTDVSLDPAAIDEQLPSGTLVGTLTSEDPDNVYGDSHTYALVAGIGDDDNADFTITGDQVFSNVLFDKDVKDAYTIRVETTDAGSGTFDKAIDITIRDVNQLPTNLSLNGATINENEPAGTTVGTLTTVDPDAPDTHVYTLVSGTGDDDNSFFMTLGDQLQNAQPLDFEARSIYSIRIQSDDTRGGTIEETFTISAVNVAESPAEISLSSHTVDENQSIGSTVGTLSAIDPDGTGSITFELIAGFGDNDLFSISGNSLLSAGVFDFESDNSLDIKIEVSDGVDPPVEKELTISVQDVNEAPTMDDATVTVSEHASGVYTLEAIDPDEGDQLTYGFISDLDELFQMNTATGVILVRDHKTLDFETKTQHVIQVVATDQDGLSGTATLTINVSDVEERNYADLEMDPDYVEGITFGDSPFIIEALSKSDAPITFESASENISISGSVVTILGAGEATIKASQEGNDTHRPDTDEITFSIGKASHFVVFDGPIEDKLTTDDPFALELITTADIPLIVNVVSGPATASDNLITLTGEAGIVELLLSTAPHDDYNYVGTLAGFLVTDVAKQDPVITFDPPAFTYVKDGELVLSASSNTDMPISFDLFDSYGLATLDGDKLTPFSVGTVSILASVPGDDAFNPAVVLQTIEIKPVFSVSGNVYNGSFQTYTAGIAVMVNADNGEIQEQVLNEFGFVFSQIKDGSYYLGVDPENTDNEPFYSTFYGDVIFWQDAELITITNDDIYGLEIHMKSKATEDLLIGSGTIAGRILEDDGTGARAIQGRILEGTPIADVSVFLIRTSDDQLMTEVFSDVNGDFKIEGIPEGEYRLQIEVTGAAMDLAGSSISIDAVGTPVVLTAMVGENGISVESSIVASVEEESFPEGVGVYPNPFTDQLNLKINNDWYGDISIKVYSSDGKLLSTRLINKSFSVFDAQLKVGNLPKGLLLLQLIHGEKVANVRIIKN
ncbi:MAG: cadherin domain-containing protein [Reichenbachiella sp.]|uniref:cadherin domain-containing protein n=1 Tax=Reichenbachiella sp. TaxID=2184521 RepID=UPI0032630C4C